MNVPRRKILKSAIPALSILSAPSLWGQNKQRPILRMLAPEGHISPEFFQKFGDLIKIDLDVVTYISFQNLQEKIFNYVEGDLDIVLLPSEHISPTRDLGFLRPVNSELLSEVQILPKFQKFEGSIFPEGTFGVIYGYDYYGMVVDISQYPISKKTQFNTFFASEWKNKFGLTNDYLVIMGLAALANGKYGGADYEPAQFTKLTETTKSLIAQTAIRNLTTQKSFDLLYAAKVKAILGIGQGQASSLIKQKRKIFNFIPETGGMIRGAAACISKYTRQEEFCNLFIASLCSAKVQALLFNDSVYNYSPVNKALWDKASKSEQDVFVWRGMVENAVQPSSYAMFETGVLHPVLYPKKPNKAKYDEIWETNGKNG